MEFHQKFKLYTEFLWCYLKPRYEPLEEKMNGFEIEFKDKLIAHLNMEEIDPSEITEESTLFGEGSGLELDSIDAIEIEVFLTRR